MSNQVATTTGKKSVMDLIKAQAPAFKMALGNEKLAEHFVRTALTEVNKTPQLAQCDGMTLLAALMQAAQLNLYVGGTIGQSYLIPYYSSKRSSYEAQFQIGYQGFIDLFYRHPLAKELYAEPVYSGDKFKISMGTDRSIIHEPLYDGDRGNVIGYYAISKLSTGAQNFVYMSVSDVTKWRDHYARADRYGKRGVWDTDFDAMALKTVIKRVLKYMPKSVELIRAMSADESVRRPVKDIELEDVEILPNRIDYDQTPETPIEIVQEPEQKPAKSAKTAANESKAISDKKIALLQFVSRFVPQEEQDGYNGVINDAATMPDLEVIESNLNTNFGGEN